MEQGTILIVEPDRDCAAEIEEALGQNGFKNPVVHLLSWVNAKAYLLREPPYGDPAPTKKPEVILLSFGDEPKPEQEFVRWVRRQTDFSDLIVIALGRLTRHTDVSDAYDSGVNAYFVRGASFEPMLRTLRSIGGLRPHPPVQTLLAETKIDVPTGPPPIFLATESREDGHRIEQTLGLLRLENPVVHFHNATDMRAEFEKNRIPIVLFLDLRLSGSQPFLAWIQARKTDGPTGIIAVTNSHDMRMVIQAYHLGANSFIKLPPKTEEMHNALTSIRGVRIREAGQLRWLENETAHLPGPSSLASE